MSAVEIFDIKKARLLFKSVININFKYGLGWIVVVCLEEFVGKL